jgi:hypothetical protein
VLSLDRLLQVDDGIALLLEGLLLARTRDAEDHQFALELRELRVPLLQRLLRRLASDALPLERRPGVDKSGPCWGVTRKIRMTALTRVRVLNTFKYKMRAQRDCDSLCK